MSDDQDEVQALIKDAIDVLSPLMNHDARSIRVTVAPAPPIGWGVAAGIRGAADFPRVATGRTVTEALKTFRDTVIKDATKQANRLLDVIDEVESRRKERETIHVKVMPIEPELLEEGDD